MACWELEVMSRSCAMTVNEGATMDDDKGDIKEKSDTINTMSHLELFFQFFQFLGFSGSSGPSQSTKHRSLG
jgi:hypothetical protein